ncbi:hypothetical protein KEM60_00186 [Austwickia sp. TVS 96-490-7B]|uniref:helix-turn-helix transcriptional regulator n=1 Tax=Austwickia sp. TVS 96-490-7B TaxID=2830843 RepID=UPI001C57859C|nr:helix-turn-helix domain-containing protein [Austwickia sp. TVS 96-490-7B]MBW3084003.1 hypothetical protein [Austwickia sp. TVS 96-490-7B]
MPRAAVWETLSRFSRPVTVFDLADACHQHPNTVREHLDALVRAGLATRATSPARGRGRPAILYRADHWETQRPDTRELCALADLLITQLEETDLDPQDWGIRAGIRRGMSLAEPSAPGVNAATARARALLTEQGYSPADAPDGTIALRECPLLSIARRHPDVVCSLHRGTLLGIYRAHGVDTARAMKLTPFARPGCCLVEIPCDSGSASVGPAPRAGTTPGQIG